MQTKDAAFELEKFVPGAFLAQGMAGGVLAGFTLMLALILWTDGPDAISFIVATPVVMLVGGLGGVCSATIMWAVHHLFGIQMRPLTRIVATVLTIRLITVLLGMRWRLEDQSLFALGTAIALLTGVPMALLIGSGIKPWQICTFGSVGIGPTAYERRVGSYSLLGTLGTLPLRFMGIAASAAWILYVSCQRKMDGGVMVATAAVILPIIYPAYSAYVTFKSPSKEILLVIGLVVNIPVALFAFLGGGNYKDTYWFGEPLLHLSSICTAFVIAWGIFLIARLTARTNNPVLTLDDLLREQETEAADMLDNYPPAPRLVFGNAASLTEGRRQ
jgi:hypothetical protein